MSIDTKHRLTIALSKGRIFEESLPLLQAAGIQVPEALETSRKLIFNTSHPDIGVLIIRASDVPVFVSYGAVDLGIAGKDVLLEHDVSDVYELLDLEISRCRLMLASKPDTDLNRPRLKIATKYANTTRQWYADQGQQVEVIKLYGSMELAPIVRLSDAIVDVVDSGRTLQENGLVTRSHIMDISSRLIVNRASMKMKSARIKSIVEKISQAVQSP